MPGSVLGTGDSVSKKDTVLTRISNCLQHRCPGRIIGPNWVSKTHFLVRESSENAYTLPYTKYIASGNLLYDSGNSYWGSVTT